MDVMIQKFHEAIIKQKAYNYVLYLTGWDSATEAPHGSFARRAEMLGIISQEAFRLIICPEYQEIVNMLFARIDELDDVTRREIKKAKKALDKIVKIPENEYVGYQKLISLTQVVWEDAKANNDYNSFKTNLAEIIQYNKRFIKYYGIDDLPYNILLDEFEEDMTMKDYDQLFNLLKAELVPFVKEVIAAQKSQEKPFETAFYPKDKQMQFSDKLMNIMAFDRSRGLLKTSVHPFTWNTSPSDVRLTTHILENTVFSSVFSTIHELGHATYEQQIDEKWDNTLLSGGTSSGIHESQSRFYENIIGRSKEFWNTHLADMQAIFPEQLAGVTVDDVIIAINKVQRSFIRTEADELTYSLHVMVRYELEKRIFSEEISVDDLPKIWNELMVEYLGIEPQTDTEGILQDVHWSEGMFGYFPTYALGSAFAAQIYYTMKKELDIEAILSEPTLGKINAWLKTKIHQYGSSKTAKEILKEVTNEDFNPEYYLRYLKEKYTALYLQKEVH
ncbi:MAG: carboxypeptidase M32 [Candidatus Izemoplasmatales bacterium]|jgi:carboxypeptidase Taq|nr:carboxypeptidase M32 [Candidatus Izemoplasmatales bacterium]MDD3865170.1 carboxypeptidase M32 [Candidatus Izemoplasmatales bacterium]